MWSSWREPTASAERATARGKTPQPSVSVSNHGKARAYPPFDRLRTTVAGAARSSEPKVGWSSKRGADHQGPEGLELGARVLHQGYAHVLDVGQQEVLVVAGAQLPALDDLVQAGLPGADILG